MDKKRKKYKIVLDTNIVRLDGFENIKLLFSSAIIQLSKFLNKNRLTQVSLAMPQCVIEERIQQREEEIRKEILAVELGIKHIYAFSEEVSSPDFSKLDIEKYYRQEAHEKLSGNKIEVISIPDLEHSTILKRALNRTKPFSKNDKGYKDTLIWLSILEDAKNNIDTNYIFVTNNIKDFDHEEIKSEFKQFNSQNFHLVHSINEVEQFFDKELDLDLDLQQRNEKIEEEIKKNVGALMIEINSYSEIDNPFYWANSPYNATALALSGINSDEKEYYFDPTKLEINNIEQGLFPQQFSVDVDLTVMKRTASTNARNSYSTLAITLPSFINQPELLRLSLLFNMETKEFKINTMLKASSLSW